MSEVSKATIKIDLDDKQALQSLSNLQKQFQATQKALEKATTIRKTKKKIEDNKELKNIEETSKKINERLKIGFSGLNLGANNFISNLGKINALLTLMGLGLSAVNSYKFGSNLSNLSTYTKIPVENLSSMTNFSTLFGGNKKNFQQDTYSFQRLQDQYKLYGEGALKDIRQRYGLNLTNSRDLKQVIDQIRGARKNGLGDASTRDILEQLGISDTGIKNAVFATEKEYKRNIEDMDKMATVQKASIETIKEFRRSISMIGSSLNTAGVNVLKHTKPFVDKVGNLANRFNKASASTQQLIVGSLETTAMLKLFGVNIAKINPHIALATAGLYGIYKVYQKTKDALDFDKHTNKKGEYVNEKGERTWWTKTLDLVGDTLLDMKNLASDFGDFSNSSFTMLPTSTGITNANINNTKNNNATNNTTNNNNYTINVNDATTGREIIHFLQERNLLKQRNISLSNNIM